MDNGVTRIACHKQDLAVWLTLLGCSASLRDVGEKKIDPFTRLIGARPGRRREHLGRVAEPFQRLDHSGAHLGIVGDEV